MRNPLFAAALFAGFLACASAPSESDDSKWTGILVTYPADVASARDAVVEAFKREGVSAWYSEGEPHSVEGTVSRADTSAVIRAQVLRREIPEKTTIEISGWYNSVPGPHVIPSGRMDKRAISSTCAGVCAVFWGRMERIAEALRADRKAK